MSSFDSSIAPPSIHSDQKSKRSGSKKSNNKSSRASFRKAIRNEEQNEKQTKALKDQIEKLNMLNLKPRQSVHYARKHASRRLNQQET